MVAERARDGEPVTERIGGVGGTIIDRPVDGAIARGVIADGVPAAVRGAVSYGIDHAAAPRTRRRCRIDPARTALVLPATVIVAHTPARDVRPATRLMRDRVDASRLPDISGGPPPGP